MESILTIPQSLLTPLVKAPGPLEMIGSSETLGPSGSSQIPILPSSIIGDAKSVEYSQFFFNHFPLEESTYLVSFITSRPTSLEVKPLLNYLELIFPSNGVSCIEKNTAQYHKNLILTWDTLDTDWTDMIALKQTIERCNCHVLSIGSYQKIPMFLLSNSQVIIFDTQQDADDYLEKQRRVWLAGFPFQNNYLVTNKQNQDIEYQFISRESLKKYE